MDIAELGRRSALGSAAAQTTLGLYYLFGYGPVGINYTEAFRLLSMASKQGASTALVNLAYMYQHGLGIEKNNEQAIKLYEQVGRVQFFAALELGRIYSQGSGVQQDSRKALEWYLVVAAYGGPEFNEDLRNELDEAKDYIKQSGVSATLGGKKRQRPNDYESSP